ncbi:hypothetical protein ACIBKZ_27570 [Streptomyces sp. NPDC050421]|uniref:hypothetical protein n=1 Tax=unclassified Streptomyces TaxID=2593676 RepID=UPI0037A508FB
MTPLPGPPLGNAPPGSRQDGPADHGRTAAARRFLAALLLAVLAVAGGAPAAAGAGLPARSSGGPAPTAEGPAGIRPAGPPAGRSLRTDRTVRTHTHPGGRAPGDRDARDALRRAGAVTAAGVHRSGPVTAPHPWAAAEHPRTPQHLPPPGPGTLPPLPPGIPAPHPVPGSAPAAPTAAGDRFRAALPGVRGPPRAAVHRPGDLPPAVPNLITAVPFPPS